MFKLIRSATKISRASVTSHTRQISKTPVFCQHTNFEFDVNKFNDIHIKSNHVVKFSEQTAADLSTFESTLKASLATWSNEKRSAVWIYLPINLAKFASVSAKYGFKYHHAENDEAVLCKWLPESRESKIPMFASHQVGVAGIVYRPDTNQLLMIQDKNMARQVWKFPGGAANLGENIEETAVREVFEETGIQSKFASVIGFRQHHKYPGGFGRSDLYVVCRLEPLSYEINACRDEIKECEWIDLDEMCDYAESRLTQNMAQSIRYGREHGFENVDIKPRQMESAFPGRFFKYFYRNLD